ncbi:MAG: hypothetical protein M1819_003485 [Sarea resinae]|nr:MAG: hypothetical protein M1819_003485 [Sarea resinae]
MILSRPFATPPQAGTAEAPLAQLSKSIIDEETLPLSTSSSGPSGLIQACALTSGTLLLVGGWAHMFPSGSSLGRRKGSLGAAGDHERRRPTLLSPEGAKKMVVRAVGVGLPFYAALKLGGVLTGVIMLVAETLQPRSTKNSQGLSNQGLWKTLTKTSRFTSLLVVLGLICDCLGLTATSSGGGLVLGYLALITSVLVLPFPTAGAVGKSSLLSTGQPASASSTSAVPSTPWEPQNLSEAPSPDPSEQSPLIASPEETQITLQTGSALAILTVVFSIVTASSLVGTALGSLWLLMSMGFAALSITFSRPSSLGAQQGISLLVGLLLSAGIGFLSPSPGWAFTFARTLQPVFFYLAMQFDAKALAKLNHTPGTKAGGHSQITEFLLQNSEQWPLLYSILCEKDSRRIFYFMALNFGFMLVQTFYGLATGSLGLLSDSIHMFFDCLALVVGLCAAVMSKWPPSMRFPYGYGKMDTLSGFANGIFLMLISIEIVYEAIERLSEGSEMRRLGELLTVSILGLGVNLVGILAFDHAHHGHSHSHGGHGDHSHAHVHDEHDHHLHDHDHDHDHGHDHDDDHSLHSHVHVPSTPSKKPQSHGHHHHGNENMHGIFLHILADTLGSVAVVISTILVHYYGWAGFDPIASCFIAILIFASAIPLVSSSAKTLLLTIPEDIEYNLRETLSEVSSLRGVVGYTVPRFWLDDSSSEHADAHDHDHDHDHDHLHVHEEDHECSDAPKILGVMHVMASRTADLDDVRRRTVRLLSSRNMDVVVQVEREGEGRCWCGGGAKV